MGLAERLMDGLRATLELRGEVERASARIEDLSRDVLDHEKRLIRLETIEEMAGMPRPRRLPPPKDEA